MIRLALRLRMSSRPVKRCSTQRAIRASTATFSGLTKTMAHLLARLDPPSHLDRHSRLNNHFPCSIRLIILKRSTDPSPPLWMRAMRASRITMNCSHPRQCLLPSVSSMDCRPIPASAVHKKHIVTDCLRLSASILHLFAFLLSHCRTFCMLLMTHDRTFSLLSFTVAFMLVNPVPASHHFMLLASASWLEGL